ncbi:MAG: OmpA family protein [Acidimicrobiales bacterium]|nr:OmpA family protein [Acidimicrobiales bacterium]
MNWPVPSAAFRYRSDLAVVGTSDGWHGLERARLVVRWQNVGRRMAAGAGAFLIGLILVGCGGNAHEQTAEGGAAGVHVSGGSGGQGVAGGVGSEKPAVRGAGGSGPIVSLPTTLDPSVSPPTTTMTRTLVEPPESPGSSLCRIEITVTNEQIGFAFDSADLDDAGLVLVAQLAVQLADATSVTVVGHTSAEGDRAYNLELSRRRAETVASAFHAQLGDRHAQGDGDASVDQLPSASGGGTSNASPAAPSIVAIGVGPDHPVADNATEDGRRLNRRVEVIAEAPATRCG